MNFTGFPRVRAPVNTGHSLRSGLATAAAKAGKSERSIMKQTGHRSVAVVRRYIREQSSSTTMQPQVSGSKLRPMA